MPPAGRAAPLHSGRRRAVLVFWACLLGAACASDSTDEVLVSFVPTTDQSTEPVVDEPIFSESNSSQTPVSLDPDPTDVNPTGSNPDAADPGSSDSGGAVTETAQPSSATTTATTVADQQPADTQPQTESSVPASSAASTTTIPSGDTQPVSGDIVIPTIEFAGDVRSAPEPYFGGVAQGVHTPATADRAFCDAVATINSRPRPADEFQGIVVAQQYFTVIEPLVPTGLADEFDIVLDWVAGIIERGSFPENDDGEIGSAVDTISAFVDARCLGL